MARRRIDHGAEQETAAQARAWALLPAPDDVWVGAVRLAPHMWNDKAFQACFYRGRADAWDWSAFRDGERLPIELPGLTPDEAAEEVTAWLAEEEPEKPSQEDLGVAEYSIADEAMASWRRVRDLIAPSKRRAVFMAIVGPRLDAMMLDPGAMFAASEREGRVSNGEDRDLARA